MNRFSVFVDKTSAAFLKQLRTGGNILCNFHIRLDERPFPSDPWLDFPVIVLTWWLDGYALLHKTREPVENTFMNGPFEFLTELRGENIVITCRKRGLTEHVEIGSPFTIKSEKYIIGLVQAGEALATVLPDLSIKGADIKNLKAALGRARSF